LYRAGDTDLSVEDGACVVEIGRIVSEILTAVDRKKQSNIGRDQQRIRGGQYYFDDPDAAEVRWTDNSPRVATVGRFVESNAFEQALRNKISGTGVHDVWIARIEGHCAHGIRRHEVRLGFPRCTAVKRLPDTAVLSRDVDGLVGTATWIDRDIGNHAGGGTVTLEILLGVYCKRRRANLSPLLADEAVARMRER